MTEQHGEAARTAMKSASAVILLFGGIRPMAKKMGIAVTTVQGWKERDVIPSPRHDEVLRAAERHGIPLTMADLTGEGQEGGADSHAGVPWHRPSPAPAPDAIPAAPAPTVVADQPAEVHGAETEATAEMAGPSAESPDVQSHEEDEAGEAEPAPAAARSPGGFGRAVRRLAAVIVVGALIVGGSVYAWWQWGGGTGTPPWIQLAQDLGLAPEPAPPPAEPAAATEPVQPIEEAAAAPESPVEETAAVEAPAAETPADSAAPAPAMEEEQEAARAVSEELTGDVSGLRSRLDAAVAGLQDIEAKLATIEALEARLAALEQSASATVADGADPGAQATALKNLEDRLAALEAGDGGVGDGGGETVAQLAQRVQALESRRGGGAAAELAERVQALESRTGEAPATEALAQRVEALESKTDQGAAVEALDQRVAALETKPEEPPAAPPGSREAALVVAVGQLREALRGAGPFAAELQAVQALAGDDAEFAEVLAPVAGRADRGIATLVLLRDRFRPVAGAVVQASRLPAEPRWYDKALHKMTSLASVRRTGDVAGDGPEAIVARAELSLAKGDLPGAVEALGKLDGPAASSVGGWLEEAKSRLDAEASLKSLQALAIARLQAAAPDAGAPDAKTDN